MWTAADDTGRPDGALPRVGRGPDAGHGHAEQRSMAFDGRLGRVGVTPNVYSPRSWYAAEGVSVTTGRTMVRCSLPLLTSPSSSAPTAFSPSSSQRTSLAALRAAGRFFVAALRAGLLRRRLRRRLRLRLRRARGRLRPSHAPSSRTAASSAIGASVCAQRAGLDRARHPTRGCGRSRLSPYGMHVHVRHVAAAQEHVLLHAVRQHEHLLVRHVEPADQVDDRRRPRRRRSRGRRSRRSPPRSPAR